MKLKPSIKNTIKFIVLNTVFIITLYFVYKELNFQQARLGQIDFKYSYLAVAFVLMCLYYVGLALSWEQVASLYIDTKKHKGLYTTGMTSQIFKYLPSSLFLLSFKAYFTKQFGVSLKDSGKSILLEQAFVIYTGFVVFGLYKNIYLGFLLLCIEFLGFYINKKEILPLKKIPLVKDLLDMKYFSFERLIKINIYLITSFTIGGVALYVLSYSTGHTGNILQLISYQALSISMTILAIFSPGGVGVKEYILSLGGASIELVILWRMITIAVEFSSSVLGYILQKFYTK